MAISHKMKRSSNRTRSGRSRAAAGRNRTRKSGERKSRPASQQTPSSKWIDSPDDHEDRQGQSLATRNHDVIRRWAEARGAVPSAAGGTKRGKGAGVLRMDFPGYGGTRLMKIEWDEWFETFDRRNLVFLFQEHKKDGSMSNFFKLNSPESKRESRMAEGKS